jgi:hypothetical protein
VTLIRGVPLLFELLTRAAAEAGALTTPNFLVFAGEAMPGRVLAGLPPVLPQSRWFNNYGCTETNNSSCTRWTAPRRSPRRCRSAARCPAWTG